MAEGTSKNFKSFTPRAQKVLAFAHEEAVRLDHAFVGTEHLLFGLVKLGQGVAVNVLAKLGLDLQTVRSEVQKQDSFIAQKEPGKISYSPGVKKVLSIAHQEAGNLQHTYIGTEHILLGMLCERESVAADIFKSRGIDIEKVRQEILRELDPYYSEPGSIVTAYIQKNL